jgi:hypothetical protein
MMWGCEQDSAASEKGLVEGCYDHGNDPLGYMKGTELFVSWTAVGVSKTKNIHHSRICFKI